MLNRSNLTRLAATACMCFTALWLTSCDTLLGEDDLTEGGKIVSECFSDGEPDIPSSAAAGRGFQKEELQMALFGPNRETVRICRPSGISDLYPITGCMNGSGPVDWAPGPILLCSALVPASSGGTDSQTECLAGLGNPTCSCSQDPTSGAVTCVGSVPVGSYSYSTSTGETLKAECYDSSSKTYPDQCVITVEGGTLTGIGSIPLPREGMETSSAQTGASCALNEAKNAYACSREVCTYEEEDFGDEPDPQDEAVADVFLGLTRDEFKKLNKQLDAIGAILGDQDVSDEYVDESLIGLSLAAVRRFSEGDNVRAKPLLREIGLRVRPTVLRAWARKTSRLGADRAEDDCPTLTRNGDESLTLNFDTCDGGDEDGTTGQIALTGPKLALDMVEGLLGDRPVSVAGDLRGLLTIETNNFVSHTEGDRVCERRTPDDRACVEYGYESIREETKAKVTVLYDLGGFKFEFDEENETAAIKANGSVEVSFERFDVRETNSSTGEVTDSGAVTGSVRFDTNIDAAVKSEETGDDDAGSSKTNVTINPGHLRATAGDLAVSFEDFSFKLDGTAALDLDLTVLQKDEFDDDRGGTGPSDMAVKVKSTLLARGLKLLATNDEGSVDLEISTKMDADVSLSENGVGYPQGSTGRTREDTFSGSFDVGCLSLRARTTSAEEGMFESLLETRVTSSFQGTGKDFERENGGATRAESSESTSESSFTSELKNFLVRLGVLDKTLEGGVSSMKLAGGDKLTHSYSSSSEAGSSYTYTYSDEEEDRMTLSLTGGYTSFAGKPYVVRTSPDLSSTSSSRSGRGSGDSRPISTEDGSSSGVLEITSGDTLTMETVTEKDGDSVSQEETFKLNGVVLSDANQETSCEDPGALKTKLGDDCRSLAKMICACPTLPEGVTQNDCDLADQGYSCDLPGETASEEDCRSATDAIVGSGINICSI